MKILPREPTHEMLCAVLAELPKLGSLDAARKVLIRAWDAAPDLKEPEIRLTSDQSEALGNALRSSSKVVTTPEPPSDVMKIATQLWRQLVKRISRRD